MAIAATRRQELIKDYRRRDGDTGSPEVQVAMLTERMGQLSEHLRRNAHDFASRRGLVLMVGKRNRLLRYLARTNREAYKVLIKWLGLRK